MSEIEAAAAPTSTADIAASVIETAEQSDASADSTGYAEPTETAAEPEAKTPDPVAETTEAPKLTKSEASRAAEFLRQMGHDLKRSDGRRAFMPVDTVAKMLDRYVEENSTAWTSERSTLESKTKELQGYIDQLRAGVAGDETAFLKELASIDQRYSRFLQPPTESKATPAAADDPMPDPDYDLGNGQKTYSFEGLRKLREWDKRQTLRELEGKLEERLKPLTERETRLKEEETRSRQMSELQQRTASQLDEAQTWPLFGKIAEDGKYTEFQQAVLDELKADSAKAKQENRRPSLTLEGAYIRIASKRFTEDDTTKRARLLEEINKAPKSTAITRTATDAMRQAGPRTTTDITRDVIAKLEKGA